MIKCDFCGATKQETTFIIGAKSSDDSDNWCMVEGTGKMACPKCYRDASDEGQRVIDRHIATHNARNRQ